MGNLLDTVSNEDFSFTVQCMTGNDINTLILNINRTQISANKFIPQVIIDSSSLNLSSTSCSLIITGADLIAPISIPINLFSN